MMDLAKKCNHVYRLQLRPFGVTQRAFRRWVSSGVMLTLASLFLMMGTVQVHAQNPKNMTVTELQDRASRLVGKSNFAGARIFLEELLRRLKGMPNPPESLESMLFFYGRGFMHEYSIKGDQQILGQAIKAFEDYLKHYPKGPNAPYATMNIADSHRGLGEFKKAVPYLEQILTPPMNRVADDQLKIEATEKIAQAFYILRDWKSGLPWFKRILQSGYDSKTTAFASTASMEAYMETNQLDKALALLPNLSGDNPSRYDINFNVSLFKAGVKLVESGRYNQGALVFGITLSLDEIKQYYESNIADMEQQMNLLRTTSSSADNKFISELKVRLTDYKNRLNALSGVADYTAELQMHVARTFVKMGRNWEGLWAYRELLKKYPDHELYDTLLYSAFEQAKRVQENELMIQLGTDYLNKSATSTDKGRYLKEISVLLAEHYRNQGMWETLIQLCEDFIEKYPKNQYAGQLAYLLGDSYLQTGQAFELESKFSGYVRQFPDASMVDALLYWGGLGSIYTGNLMQAAEYMDRIINEFPNSPYYSDAIFRSGVAYFGMNDFANAKDRCLRQIKEFPDSSIRGEVELTLGQVYGNEGTPESLKKAIEYFNAVPKHTEEHHYVITAVFEKAKLLERNNKYADVAQALTEYLNDYEEHPEADIPGAVFRLGKAYEQMQQPGRMLKVYMDAIEEYGNDPSRTDVDSIFEAYPKRYYANLNILNANVAFLEKMIDDAVFRDRIVGLPKEPPKDPRTGRYKVDPESWVPRRDKQFVFEYFLKQASVVETFDQALVDDELQRKLKRDDDFAKSLLQDTAPLRTLLLDWQRRLDAYPSTSPEDTFMPMYREARASGAGTMQFRLQFALEQLGQKTGDYNFSPEDFEFASPKILLWMGKKAQERNDAETAMAAFQYVADNDPESDGAIEAYWALAEFYENYRLDNEEAYKYYKLVEDTAPSGVQAPMAAVKQAQLLGKMGRSSEAEDILDRILRTPEWSGESHAYASYQIGLNLLQEGKREEAHHQFRRTYVSFAYFAAIAAKACLEDAQLLIKMGRANEAKEALEWFVDKPQMHELPEYQEAQRLLRTL